MIDCAYCERPLVCDHCQAAYIPPSQEAYGALSIVDVAVTCHACGDVLVCRWCKTPYDGKVGDEESDSPGDAG